MEELKLECLADGAVRVCLSQGEAQVCTTVSSMHLAEEKRRQLEKALESPGL